MSRYEDLQARLRAQPRAWLVTGAAGFIGSHLVERLLRLDQRVVGLDNFSLGRPGNLEEATASLNSLQRRNFQFIEGDIRSLATCARACRSVSYVLHQAALGSVPASIADPVATHESNVAGFLNMLVAARDAGVARFVYAGSSATYGDYPAVLQVEDMIGRALSPYGVSKHVDELYAANFARCYGFASIGLRYFNVFGPRQRPDSAYAAVIPAWIAAMIRGEPVTINGDGSTTRDFCHVDNVAQANLLAATSEDPDALDQVYNIALNRSTSLHKLFEMLRALLAPRYPRLRDLRPRYREFRVGDVRFSQADIGKAQRLLGYRPELPVREGLERSLDWYIEALEPGARGPAAARRERRAPADAFNARS
jgi:UDP-N-acetylglucosamine 4-epimerase